MLVRKIIAQNEAATIPQLLKPARSPAADSEIPCTRCTCKATAPTLFNSSASTRKLSSSESLSFQCFTAAPFGTADDSIFAATAQSRNHSPGECADPAANPGIKNLRSIAGF